jgi:obg-like ATPase 1
MPPKAKKNDGQEDRVMLGRFSNNLKLGLVGYPNVGKSLVFNTLSKLSVNSENYPFATIVFLLSLRFPNTHLPYPAA